VLCFYKGAVFWYFTYLTGAQRTALRDGDVEALLCEGPLDSLNK
jgi:hypothetical protein